MKKIEELESELKQLTGNHNESAAIIEAMQVQINALKAEAAQGEEWPKVGDEWPKVGDEYYLAYSTGTIACVAWGNDSADKNLTASGNVHRTKEEAEAYRAWLTNPRTQARRRVEMCDGFDSIGLRGIVSDDGGTIFPAALRHCYGNSGLRFTTVQQAVACIDLLGEDVIKCALGVDQPTTAQ